MRFPRAVVAFPICWRFAPLVLLAACGGDLTLPNEGQPSTLTVAGGNNQNGTIGEPLIEPLVVRVTDGFGDPVAGVTVVWSAETGGTVDPASSVTSGSSGWKSTARPSGCALVRLPPTSALTPGLR